MFSTAFQADAFQQGSAFHSTEFQADAFQRDAFQVDAQVPSYTGLYLRCDSWLRAQIAWGQVATIAGVDVSTKIDWASISINDTLAPGRKNTICSFTLKDPTIKPKKKQIVVIQAPVGTKLFEGRIAEYEEFSIGISSSGDEVLGYNITCSDYTADLNKEKLTYVFKSGSSPAGWSDYTARGIMSWVIDNKVNKDKYGNTVDTFTYNNASSGGIASLSPLSADHIDVSAFFDTIMEQAGGWWYIDFNKDLHVFFSNEGEAPIVIDENYVREGIIWNLRIKEDATQIANAVQVAGATSTQDRVEKFDGDGVRTIFPLAYEFLDSSDVTAIIVNGNQVDPSNIGIDRLSSSKVAYVNPDDNLVRFESAPSPGTNNVEIRYNSAEPLLTFSEDYAAIADLNSVTADGGRREDYVTGFDLQTTLHTELKAKAVLAERAYSRKVLTFQTYLRGFKPGQLLRVQFTKGRYDDAGNPYMADLLIFSLNTQMVGVDPNQDHFAEYTIEAGKAEETLTDIIVNLIKREKAATGLKTEVLNDLLPPYNTIEMNQVPAMTLTAPPWKWAPSDKNMVWDFFEWG